MDDDCTMHSHLKKRDKGSRSVGQKVKSLLARWFSKIEVKELVKRQLPPGTSTSAVLGPLFPRIERDVIVRVNCKESAVAEDFAMLAVFNKHCNKWLMMTDDFPEWKWRVTEGPVGRTSVTASIINNATSTATATSESGTSDITREASSSKKKTRKKKEKKKEKDSKYRLLLCMLLYDAEMSQLFQYMEIDIERGDTQKEVFRLVELCDVIVVTGKLVTT